MDRGACGQRDGWSGTNTLNELDEDVASDEIHPGEYIDKAYDDDVDEPTKLDDLSVLLREIIFWITSGNRNRRDYRLTVFRKCVAFAWVMRPEVFDGKSLRSIAKENGVRVKFTSLSVYATRFADRFGIRHGGMMTEQARDNYRTASKKGAKGRP